MADRLADGRRIAELLASELEGRRDRGLDRVGVSDADPAVEPTADGARAFDVTRSGEVLASVLVQPDQVLVAFPSLSDPIEAAVAGTDLELIQDPPSGGGARVVVPDGAAVKRVVPVIRAAVES